MARIEPPADPLAGLVFEVERFEWTTGDRIEVSGRWFGVRGRRFMRPTLHFRVDGRRRRLIALLDHKPWAPDTEGAWTAAFAWRGPSGEISSPRLEVSPDLVLDLPLPGAEASGTAVKPRPRPKPPARKPAAKKEPAAKAPAEAPAAKLPASPPADTAPLEPPPATAAPASPPADAPRKPAPKSRPADAPPKAAPKPPPADAPPKPAPPEAAPTSPPDAAPASPPADPPAKPDIAQLALERRLVEERAERERLQQELDEARAQIAALSSHQASAVERANEVVRLEGELAAALQRAEAAERRADALEQAEPLTPRRQRRQPVTQHPWAKRAAAIAVVAIVLVLLLVTLL